MSRRSQKDWENSADGRWRNLNTSATVGGGEDWHVSHELIAQESGLDYLEYVTTYPDGSESVDEERLEADARAALDSIQPHEKGHRVLAVMTVRCNRCDHRIDVIVLQHDFDTAAPGVTRSKDGLRLRSRYASGMRRLIGEQPRWQHVIEYACRRCGRQTVRLSRDRVNNFFGPVRQAFIEKRLPDEPEQTVVNV